MNVRSQVSMVFHLDKCIGCHTCSLACKNLWTSRPGAEYMWWNNVETKPGTGYPTLYEDQEQYRGGWEVKDGELRLKHIYKMEQQYAGSFVYKEDEAYTIPPYTDTLYIPLEDRVVKEFGRQLSRGYQVEGEVDVPELRRPVPPELKVLTRKAIKPSEAEIRDNPRSRSAQLRAFEKL